MSESKSDALTNLANPQRFSLIAYLFVSDWKVGIMRFSVKSVKRISAIKFYLFDNMENKGDGVMFFTHQVCQCADN